MTHIFQTWVKRLLYRVGKVLSNPGPYGFSFLPPASEIETRAVLKKSIMNLNEAKKKKKKKKKKRIAVI